VEFGEKTVRSSPKVGSWLSAALEKIDAAPVIDAAIFSRPRTSLLSLSLCNSNDF